MPQIEIITATPALTAINLSAPSILTEKIRKGMVKAAKSVAGDITITSFVDTDILSKNLKEFLQHIQPVFDEVSVAQGKFRINEIELKLAISAEGGIKLVGEFSAGIETSITLKLSREKL